MSKVLIIVNSEVQRGKVSPISPVATKMVTALVNSIQNSMVSAEIEIISAADLWSKSIKINSNHEDLIYCPLTIKLPDWINFPSQHIFKSCIDIVARRAWVENYCQHLTAGRDLCLGDLWLPIVLTAKGPIYGEVIGEGEIPNFYQQPIDLSDQTRQSLYNLAYQLLESIDAIPSVYLLQFRILEKKINFDRLWPFPASPAIASIQSQVPNLFNCHWHCLLGKPILDLTIMPKS